MILLGAVLVGIATEMSAYFSDAEAETGQGMEAGTVDILPGAAHWYRHRDEFGPCGSSIHLLLPITNGGSLPLDYEVEALALGELAGKVDVEVYRSSDHLGVGEDDQIEVVVTLRCWTRFRVRDHGSLRVTVVGTNAGLYDQEVWSNGFWTGVESDE